MTLEMRPLDRPETLKELAFRQIKGLMTGGRLEADTLYSANQLAEMLGVSRTPVREALLELAAEGFLSFVEGRGFRIRSYSRKETEDFFEVRRLIEVYVAEHLSGRLAREDVDLLQKNLTQMEALARKKDAAAFLETDKEFHMTLVRRYNNLFLETIMERIRGHIPIFGLKAVAHPGRYDEVLREHGRIVEALRKGDAPRIARAVLDHLTATEKYVLGDPPAAEKEAR